MFFFDHIKQELFRIGDCLFYASIFERDTKICDFQKSEVALAHTCIAESKYIVWALFHREIYFFVNDVLEFVDRHTERNECLCLL